MTHLEAVPPASAERPEIRCLIADDQALVRAGFCLLLGKADGISVVADVGDGDATLAEARITHPDLVMLDLNLPPHGGPETTSRLLADPDLAGVKVLILSVFISDDEVIAALRAGASGVLLKTADGAELVRAVRTVAGGQEQVSPGVARRLIAQFARLPRRGAPDPGSLVDLTVREREILALVAHGLTNDQIAQRLVISPATAKTHVSRAMVKLRARDRAQLVVLAYEAGLVLPPAAASA